MTCMQGIGLKSALTKQGNTWGEELTNRVVDGHRDEKGLVDGIVEGGK